MRRNKFNSLRKFERLEDRRMMAADISESNDIVTVIGTNNRDEIVIAADPEDADQVLITIRDFNTGEILEQEDYDRDEVVKIRVEARGADDIVTNNTNIPSDMFGEGGNDTLTGGSARDVLNGGANADTLEGRAGDDDLTGGTGSDTYRFFGSLLGTDVVNEAANADVDKLDFSGLLGGINVDLSRTTQQVVNSPHLTLRLSSSTGIENVVGTAFDDTIRGNSRNNELRGEGLNDRIFGGAGADTLLGGAGNDSLSGEGGLDTLDGGADRDILDGGFDGLRDVLIGGAGVDTFVLHRLRGSNPGPTEQTLSDYNSAVDLLMTAFH